MISSIISFLSGPLGKVVGYISLAGVAVTAYFLWERSVKQEATAEFNKKQLELVLKDKDELIRQMRELQVKTEQAVADLDKKNAEVSKKTQAIEVYLNSPDAIKKDRPASDIIKETIRKLEDQ